MSTTMVTDRLRQQAVVVTGESWTAEENQLATEFFKFGYK